MLSLGLITLKIIDTVLTPLHEPCYNLCWCVYNYNDMHFKFNTCVHALVASVVSSFQQCTVACQASLYGVL